MWFRIPPGEGTILRVGICRPVIKYRELEPSAAKKRLDQSRWRLACECGWPKYPCIRWVSGHPTGRGNFGGFHPIEKQCDCLLRSPAMSVLHFSPQSASVLISLKAITMATLVLRSKCTSTQTAAVRLPAHSVCILLLTNGSRDLLPNYTLASCLYYKLTANKQFD